MDCILNHTLQCEILSRDMGIVSAWEDLPIHGKQGPCSSVSGRGAMISATCNRRVLKDRCR